jgi:hypothetical protein
MLFPTFAILFVGTAMQKILTRIRNKFRLAHPSDVMFKMISLLSIIDDSIKTSLGLEIRYCHIGRIIWDEGSLETKALRLLIVAPLARKFVQPRCRSSNSQRIGLPEKWRNSVWGELIGQGDKSKVCYLSLFYRGVL